MDAGTVLKVSLRAAQLQRMTCGLDLYALDAERIGDEIEAAFARHDRDALRAFLVKTYERGM